MLTRPSESLDGALAGLSPDDRALLELSMLRGVSDGELATLLRTDPADVERRREAAMERAFGDENGGTAVEPAPAPVTVNGAGVHEANGTAPHTLEPPQEPRSARLAILLLAGLAAAAIAVVLISGREDEPTLGSVPETRPAPAAGASEPVSFRPVAGDTTASATVRREGSRLIVRVRGLPKGGPYTLWLYDSVADAVPVARFGIPNARISVRLPAEAGRYRFLDLSREPRDGNPNHSGASILRAPLAPLR